MTSRAEWLESGVDEMLRQNYGGGPVHHVIREALGMDLASALNVIEPMIRNQEYAMNKAAAKKARRETLESLRAQVETLPIYHSDAKMQYVLRFSVLAIIDGMAE